MGIGHPTRGRSDFVNCVLLVIIQTVDQDDARTLVEVTVADVVRDVETAGLAVPAPPVPDTLFPLEPEGGAAQQLIAGVPLTVAVVAVLIDQDRGPVDVALVVERDLFGLAVLELHIRLAGVALVPGRRLGFLDLVVAGLKTGQLDDTVSRVLVGVLPVGRVIGDREALVGPFDLPAHAEASPAQQGVGTVEVLVAVLADDQRGPHALLLVEELDGRRLVRLDLDRLLITQCDVAGRCGDLGDGVGPGQEPAQFDNALGVVGVGRLVVFNGHAVVVRARDAESSPAQQAVLVLVTVPVVILVLLDDELAGIGRLGVMEGDDGRVAVGDLDLARGRSVDHPPLRGLDLFDRVEPRRQVAQLDDAVTAVLIGVLIVLDDDVVIVGTRDAEGGAAQQAFVVVLTAVTIQVLVLLDDQLAVARRGLDGITARRRDLARGLLVGAGLGDVVPLILLPVAADGEADVHGPVLDGLHLEAVFAAGFAAA